MKELTPKQFEKIYKKVPRICIELVIFKGKRVLLSKRAIYPYKGFWHLPGTGILYKESINEAIKRVAKKELGIMVIPEKFLGYLETINDGYRHSVSLAFKCKIMGYQQPRALEQASDVKFFGKLPKKIVPKHKEFLNGHIKKI